MSVAINTLKIGETVFARECSLDRKYCRAGAVVWIHPQNRFAVVQMEEGGYRECFFASDLARRNEWTTSKGITYKMPMFSRTEL